MADVPRPVLDEGRRTVEGEPTVELLARVRGGDASALDLLLARHLPKLRRWAAGRLPGWARGSLDTDDLVQETFMHAIARLDVFEPQREGALQAYLRQALLNRIQDEIRRVHRRPRRTELDEEHPDPGDSPLETAVGRETLARYEAALARLRDDERALVLMRVELHCSYQEIAESLGKPSVDAARMAAGRALLRLAREMGA